MSGMRVRRDKATLFSGASPIWQRTDIENVTHT